VLFFVVARAAWAQQKERFGHDAAPVNPANYPLTLHVEHAFVNAGALHLEVALDGKHLELQSLDPLVLLHTGDYKARIAKRDEKKNGFFSATYELLFADGTHWMFAEVGESE
jgi:hypothetical protein